MVILIQHLDLKRSNAIYIFRSIVNGAKTYEEISKDTEIAEITIKKIAYELINAKILLSIKHKNPTEVGRPKVYLTPNPDIHCTVITKEGSFFTYNMINTLGEKSKLFTFPINYHMLNEHNSLAYSLHFFTQTDFYNYCQKIFYLSEESNEPVEDILNISLFELILESLVNEEKTFYVEYKNKKALINHKKVKFLNTDTCIEEIKNVIDLDDEFILNDYDQENLLNEALRIITLNTLEEKVARLF